MVSPSLPESNQLEAGTSRNEKSSYPSDDSTKADKSFDLGMNLDQAFQRFASLEKSNAPKSKIVSLVFFVSRDKELTLKG